MQGAFLLKDPLTPHAALSYRILILTPDLCRKWATLRLRHLEPWNLLWANSSMFAGIPQVSATDAWYLTALDLEHARPSQTPFVAGTVDLYKCFDQISRQLLYLLLTIGGFPRSVLLA